LALDSGVPEHVALSAVNSAMDRAGLTSKQSLEIGVAVKPYEQVIEQMESGSRAEIYRTLLRVL
jgi:putative ubiquitin-RnfH superfamily antitoxin RatB of RatAB toxin-antitoxin module